MSFMSHQPLYGDNEALSALFLRNNGIACSSACAANLIHLRDFIIYT